MTNGHPEGRIFLCYPHTNNGFFFLLTTDFFYFKTSFQKSLNRLRCICTWWRHLNITMASLNDHVREFQYNLGKDSLGKIRFIFPGQNLRYPYTVCKKHVSPNSSSFVGLQHDQASGYAPCPRHPFLATGILYPNWQDMTMWINWYFYTTRPNLHCQLRIQRWFRGFKRPALHY